ncbi:phosphate ABC transporter substrate-binding protein PstS [Fluviispira multicolorata]|uniref:Phosphate-binding protein n=1 Tax=Fluviispira multicolorata TaxID=2654512 RepID=A0A833JFL7_9BACT|nr:phosphate ABC transporter substrate-binding protein PstS [Fluviispira multicolorata]
MFLNVTRLIAVSLALTSGFVANASNLITGAGSTFIAPVLYKWSSDYNKETKIKINYQSTGSGAGLKQIEGNIVAFGASDMPLKNEELNSKSLFQFPAVIGGIVVVTNIEGISKGQLVLDAKLIAEIYSGQIKKWDDKQIQDLNPDLKLPNKSITVVYRSDASGTTFNFTHYLEKASLGVWKAGTGTAVSWPSGVTGFGGKGNEGVTSMVKRAPGSIGYVEYAYALQNKLAWARLKNADGKVVPKIELNDLDDPEKVSEAFKKSFQAAAINADWESTPGMYVLLANQKGEFTWPITASTFILIHKNQENVETGKDVLKFFHYVFKHGAKSAESLDYIPIPEKTYKFIEKKWSEEIKASKDKSPLWVKQGT